MSLPSRIPGVGNRTEPAPRTAALPRPASGLARIHAGARRRGLVGRTAVAGALLAVIVGAVFGILIAAIDEQRDSSRLARVTRDELLAVDTLEKVVIDLETGLRGYVITRDDVFLEPWNEARAAFPAAAEDLRTLVADDPVERRRTDQVIADIRSYIDDYGLPLLAAARAGDPSAESTARTAEGKRRIDALRNALRTHRIQERSELNARQDSADAAATRAATVGVIGLVASIVLIGLFTGYFGRAIVRPIRRAAGMAALLAGGELSARMPETSVGEIGELERAFNTMGASLERSRSELARLADEQAALRRVATVVARGGPSAEVFEAVAREAAQLLGGEITKVLRLESDGTAAVLGGWSVPGKHIPLGARLTVAGADATAETLATGRPARVEGFNGPEGSVAECFRGAGVHVGVATPIVIDGKPWGVLVLASSDGESLPPGAEHRLADFADLVETGIANAEARAELRRVADEQAALRSVATLVAQTRDTDEVFEAVTRAVALQCDADLARLERLESDGTVTAIAAWSRSGEGHLSVGTRFALEGESIAAQVLETGRPARVDSFVGTTGPIAREAQSLGIRSSVGCPIVVGGRTWGVIAASTTREEPFPPDTEARIGDFTELVATAVANAESHRELAASRARIVTAADEARRRIERDLHDGAQQRLVALALGLRSVQEALRPERPDLSEELARAVDALDGVLAELQRISRGIHPAILSEGGLGPALRTLARRSAIPVELDVYVDGRLPEAVEVAAYYVVSEALTNAAKHSSASLVSVEVAARDGVLRVEVRDDGEGGAVPERGSGLIGLTDRVEALGGSLVVTSPAGKGTTLSMALPLVGAAVPAGAPSG